MCPRIWPIEDICIGLYVLKRLLTVRHILEKVMSMHHSFEEFSEKRRRVKLKSVGNFVSKAVLVESANQFSLEELCRTQYILKYFFRSHIDHQTYGKTLTNSLGVRLLYSQQARMQKNFPRGSEPPTLNFNQQKKIIKRQKGEGSVMGLYMYQSFCFATVCFYPFLSSFFST